MILCGIPLDEPYLQHCLWNLEKSEKSKLKAGKLPISETFYLMGTADPTGILNYDEVCVILCVYTLFLSSNLFVQVCSMDTTVTVVFIIY